MNKKILINQNLKGTLFKVNLCKGCYKELKDEYGSSLGFISPTEITIVPLKDCDYLEMPDGRFQFEHKNEV